MRKKILSYALLMVIFLTSCEQETKSLSETNLEKSFENSTHNEYETESATQKPSSNNGEVQEKRILRITYANNLGGSMYNIVSLFQMRNPDIEVIYTDFEGKTADELDKYKAQLPVKIMGGVADDLFTMSGLSIPNLADKGIIADIYELMDTDEGFVQDNYFSETWKAFEYKDALYGIPFHMYWCYMVINKNAPEEIKKRYNELDTISYYDMIQLYNESGINHSMYMENTFKTRQGIRDEIANYLDFEDKTCDFNDTSFIEKLYYYRDALEPGAETTYTYIYGTGWADNAVRDSEKYMFRFITGFNYVIQYEVGYDENHFVYPKPLADSTGKIMVGYDTYDTNPFLLSQASQSKDLAWEFIKFALSDEMQKKYISHWSINKKIFEETDYVKDSIDALFINEGLRMDNESSKESAERVRGYLAEILEMPFTATHLYLEEKVRKVIDDEVLAFVNDIITAEQAAANIQNKVSLMLKE